MGFIVYLLCSATSLFCAVFLMRAYFKNRTRLLLWSSLCFVGIALNNILLSVDYALGSNYDLSTIRALTAVGGMGVMMYGLIWDTV